MYWHYVQAVVRRAFQPTARFTDILQIVAASAAPAIARFLGVKVPTPDETLAYIGAAAVAFVVLRLFFVAPYQVWREQVGEIAGLKLKLSTPEQLQAERFATLRADARFALCRKITDLTLANLSGDYRAAAMMLQDCASSVAPAQTAEAFANGLSRLSAYSANGHESPVARKTATDLLNNMLDYLHGSLTAEALALRLPPRLEEETQQ